MARCPACTKRQPGRWRLSFWFRTRWVCRGCGALLQPLRSHELFTNAISITGLGVFLGGTFADNPAFGMTGLIVWAGAVVQLTWFSPLVVVLTGPCCPRCTYDRSGIDRSSRCPECGLHAR